MRREGLSCNVSVSSTPYISSSSKGFTGARLDGSNTGAEDATSLGSSCIADFLEFESALMGGFFCNLLLCRCGPACFGGLEGVEFVMSVEMDVATDSEDILGCGEERLFAAISFCNQSGSSSSL